MPWNALNCNPRQAFKQDLSNYLRESLSKGKELLQEGDFNESIDNSYKGMTKQDQQKDFQRCNPLAMSSYTTRGAGCYRSRI